MTLEELSHDTFYNRENYSQLVIDLVDEVEELYTYEEAQDSFGALAYTVSNVIEIIDKGREHDLKALKVLYRILIDSLNNIN